LNVVQLGDSVAAGEGTLYGCRYDKRSRRWVGGNLNAKWPGPYPRCHDSPDAYGQHVARGVNATFLQLACTGASFSNGISTENLDPDTHQRQGPAQFGSWATRTNLNPTYDNAKPDVVLVTLGADDIRFPDIVAHCVKNALFPHARLECTAKDPGATVQKDFFAVLSRFRTDLGQLVGWIRARGRAAHKVPAIVFTNYYDPFAPHGRTCPGTWSLKPEQLTYLEARLAQLDHFVADTIRSRQSKTLGFVDLLTAFAGHTWCTSQPWAYDLSMDSVANSQSQAPFHPTPAGQEVIAGLVERELRQLLLKEAS
jgi:lysophospholipase L1-like esterase